MNSDQITKIESILYSKQFPINLEREQVFATYMPQGKASDVYKVELPKNRITYAVKLLDPNQWQLREIDLYLDYLPQNTLNTPELIYANKSEGILILNWIEPINTHLDFKEISNWLTKKYTYFKETLKDETIDFDNNLKWMILDPISKIREENKYLSADQLNTLINNIEDIKTKLSEVYALSLPIVVEHADLEAKNIINSSSGIYIIDWANAFKSFGFVDFAQFKKLLRQHNKFDTYKMYESNFSELVGLNIEEFSNITSLYAVIREIQLLAYFQERNKESQSESVQTSILILAEELKKLAT